MNLDTKNLPPKVAAYIRSLAEKNHQLEKQLVKMQSGYHCLDSVTHAGCWAHARRKWRKCFVDGKAVEGEQIRGGVPLD